MPTKRLRFDIPKSLSEHQKVLEKLGGGERLASAKITELLEQAGRKGMLAAVVTFRQHPEDMLSSRKKLPYLTDIKTRIKLLQNEGVDIIVPLSFTRELAGLDAETFIGLLRKHLSMRGLVIGPDFALGKGRKAVTCRLVMIPGPSGYLIYLTNLPRNTHGPHQVGDLYRVRYEIELDNKLDKSGAQLDQIRATTESSVRIQLAAKLLHSLIVDVLIHRDNLERTRNGYVCRGPLHRLALAYALRARHALLVTALLYSDTPFDYWDHLANLIADDGRDPNWRRRPSVLDRLLGLTAPRGRPRKKKLRECRPSAAPYRRAAIPAAMR